MGTHVVTGSASGLGAALCELLQAAGHRVIGADRADAEITADLGSPEGRKSLCDSVEQLAPDGLSGVVSCAGLSPLCAADDVLRVNYFGAVAALDGLRPALERSRPAAAVAISSMAAAYEGLTLPAVQEACDAGDEAAAVEKLGGANGTVAYCNAKRALARAVRRRVGAWGGRGIRLNAVAPGKMSTPMLEGLLGDDDQRRALATLPVPIGRVGTPLEIAEVVVFLLSDAARYVHGQVLFVDGGSEATVRPEHV